MFLIIPRSPFVHRDSAWHILGLVLSTIRAELTVMIRLGVSVCIHGHSLVQLHSFLK